MQVTDVSLLAQLQQLENLKLLVNQITDVSPLESLKQLKYLDLNNNLVPTKTQIDELDKALPQRCYVDHDVETHEDAEKAAMQLLEKGIKNVVITLGEKGAFFANSEEKFSLPIANLSNPVVDTTGAGDAFNAGFASALTEGQNIKDALKFASATAGLSTTKIGTANSMPSREEIDKLL